MEELEREWIRDFVGVTSFYKRKGDDETIHALSAQEFSNSLSSGTLQPRGKVLVLANKMYVQLMM
jgi:hypothetical protein